MLDGTIYSTDYVTGHSTRINEWSTSGSAHSAAYTNVALYGVTSLTSGEITNMTKRARKNIREFLKERGELGKGYRVNVRWQLDVSLTLGDGTPSKRPILVFRAWEA